MKLENLTFTDAEGLKPPKIIGGNLSLGWLTTLENVTHQLSHMNGYSYINDKLSQKDKTFMENEYSSKVR